MRYNQVVNFALASYPDRDRYTRRNTSWAKSSAAAALCDMRYMNPTIARRYFCTRYSKAGSSPAFTRNMTSASVSPTADPDRGVVVSAAGWCPTEPIARSSRSMATLLTSVSTPSGAESCSSCSSGRPAEVPLEEGVTDGRGGSDGNAIGLEYKVSNT